MHHQMDGKNGWAALGDNGSDLLELLEFRRTDVNLCQQTNGPEFGARLSVHPRANACSAHRTPSEANVLLIGRTLRAPAVATWAGHLARQSSPLLSAQHFQPPKRFSLAQSAYGGKGGDSLLTGFRFAAFPVVNRQR